MKDLMTPYVAENYAPIPECGCWIWLGAKSSKGYAKLRGKRQVGVHRLFYAVFKGEIPPGVVVCHKCDTPLCINPDHLFLGTQQENCLDRERKGRGRWTKLRMAA